MRIDVLTLFPEMFQGVLGSSMLGRAAQGGILEFHLHNIRDWSTNKHHNADDYPFGGGAGMVMMAQPIWDCLDQVDPNHQALRIALLPRGEPLGVPMARELSKKEWLVLLCGHYEGVDERALAQMDMEVSIGDYVLTGGELPAMVLIDCVSRFIPGYWAARIPRRRRASQTGCWNIPNIPVLRNTVAWRYRRCCSTGTTPTSPGGGGICPWPSPKTQAGAAFANDAG